MVARPKSPGGTAGHLGCGFSPGGREFAGSSLPAQGATASERRAVGSFSCRQLLWQESPAACVQHRQRQSATGHDLIRTWRSLCKHSFAHGTFVHMCSIRDTYIFVESAGSLFGFTVWKSISLSWLSSPGAAVYLCRDRRVASFAHRESLWGTGNPIGDLHVYGRERKDRRRRISFGSPGTFRMLFSV